MKSQIRQLPPSERLSFLTSEWGHAYVNVFVEALRKKDDKFDTIEFQDKDLAYWVGHLVAYIPVAALLVTVGYGIRAIFGV